MTRLSSRLLLAAVVWLALTANAAAQIGIGIGGGAAGCFSDAQTRAAIQAGQAQPLSNFIGQIQARMGGQVAGAPRLCSVGGRLAYIVTILVGGQVREVRVDALTGAVQ
jgi:uncharacterized membrane protein YkoI